MDFFHGRAGRQIEGVAEEELVLVPRVREKVFVS